MEFSHFDDNARPRMVSIAHKADTNRKAVAKGRVRLAKETIEKIKTNRTSKGDVLATAQIAAIMGAKKTSEIIPMCHNILINSVDMDFDVHEEFIDITAEVQSLGKTGVEMEALTAVNIAALTIYDMCKAVDKNIIIENIYLKEKTGGKSGHFINSKVIEGKILDVNISEKKGTVKTPVEYVNLIEDYGIENDAHAGKWHRQVSLLARESIDKMIRDYDLDLKDGDFAENLTTEGIELHSLKVGTLLKVGEAIIQVTQIGKECHTGCAIKQKVKHCIMPTEGIFARVISGGRVKKSDIVKVIE